MVLYNLHNNLMKATKGATRDNQDNMIKETDLQGDLKYKKVDVTVYEANSANNCNTFMAKLP